MTKALVERVHAMQEIVTRIEPLIPQLVAQFQKKAVERMQEALGMAIADNANASQTQQEASERIRQEVTLLWNAYRCRGRTGTPENPS